MSLKGISTQDGIYAVTAAAGREKFMFDTDAKPGSSVACGILGKGFVDSGPTQPGATDMATARTSHNDDVPCTSAMLLHDSQTNPLVVALPLARGTVGLYIIAFPKLSDVGCFRSSWKKY